jgi:hypothetical protein
VSVGQAFQPDVWGSEVRLESLTYDVWASEVRLESLTYEVLKPLVNRKRQRLS